MVSTRIERSWGKYTKLKGCLDFNLLVGEAKTMIMFESNMLEKISAYIVDNKLKAVLEAEVKYMAIEAKETKVYLEWPSVDFEPEPPDKQHVKVTSQRLDAIYDDEPLGF